jgi:homoserine acetyltransferase
MEHTILELGDFALQKGGLILPDAKLGYVTIGELNAARDNVVVCNAELRVIPTIWGHMAPFNPEDQAFIDRALNELLGG